MGNLLNHNSNPELSPAHHTHARIADKQTNGGKKGKKKYKIDEKQTNSSTREKGVKSYSFFVFVNEWKYKKKKKKKRK